MNKTELIAKLEEFKQATSDERDAKKHREEEVEEHKKSTPVPPRKRPIIPIDPQITKRGILSIISLVLCIVFIISFSINLKKNNAYQDVMRNPGEEFINWCWVLLENESLAHMSEEDWLPVQNNWAERGVKVTWKDLVKLEKKGGLDLSQMSRNFEREILDNLIGGDTLFLSVVCTLNVFLLIAGVILVLVFRKGFGDNIETIKEICAIPGINAQNEENRRYNETEYVKLYSQYEENLRIHTKEAERQKRDYEQKMDGILARKKESRDAIGHPEIDMEHYVYGIMQYLKEKYVEDLEEAYKCARAAEAEDAAYEAAVQRQGYKKTSAAVDLCWACAYHITCKAQNLYNPKCTGFKPK